MSAPNPIAPRLERLHDQWAGFAALPDARVLRWLVRAHELRLIETFVASEGDARSAQTADLFVPLDAAFVDVDQYGTALRERLEADYAASRDALADDGIATPWQPAAPRAGRHSLAHLVDACAALREAHPEAGVLALVLLPSAVADYAEWQRWLQGAAAHLPAGVRLVVADAADAPALDALQGAEPARVRTAEAALDVPGLVNAFARMGGTATPGGQFRVHFAALATALGAGDLAAARAAGERALAVADAEGWHHLGSAVHFALASGAANAGRPDEALAAYHAADGAARRAAAAGDVALGGRLCVNAAFGAAAVYLGRRDFAAAAHVYEGAAPLAEAAGDATLRVECPRMAAYCREQTGERDAAWAHGFAALAAAEGLPPDQRAAGTLPAVREGLLRLAAGSAAHVQAVEARVAAALAAR